MFGTEKANEKINLADRRLCPYYLVEYCPHELFTNTKSDLGPCDKEHDEKAKQAWNALSAQEQWSYGYHHDMQRFCEKLIGQMDAKIRRGERRAEEVSGPVEPQGVDSATKTAQSEQIEAIERRIQELMAEMDQLAEQGEVDAIDGMVEKVDRLKEEKTELLKAGGMLAQENKKMRVCDICGAFLVAGDSEKRIQAHLEGKQHIGFYTLRQTVKKLEEQKVQMAASAAPSSSGAASSSSSSKKRDDDDGGSRKARSRVSRSRSRSRSRDRERGRRRHRSRSRSRERKRSRSRSRDRRSRERKERKTSGGAPKSAAPLAAEPAPTPVSATRASAPLPPLAAAATVTTVREDSPEEGEVL